MKQDGRSIIRTLITFRYGLLAAGSIWWLYTMLDHPEGSHLWLPSLVLVVGIVYNIALDLLQRSSEISRTAGVFLRHQLLIDCLMANLFLGVMAPALMIGKPAYWGGSRTLPFDITFVTGSILLVLTTILLHKRFFPLYLGTTLTGVILGQACTIYTRRQIPFTAVFAAMNWRFVANGLLGVSCIGLLTCLIDTDAQHKLQEMTLQIAEATRERERSQVAFHKLSFLTAIIHDMSSSQQYQQTLEIITDRAALFFGADDALIATIGADPAHLSVVAAKSEYREQLTSLHITRGKGILGKAFEGDAPELIKNALLDPRAVQIYGTPEEPESMMVAPLRKGNQKYGVVSVSRIGLENPFTEDDLALFTSFGNIAASVLDNATMFETLKRKNFTLSVTNQLSSAILSPLPFAEEIINFLTIIKDSFQLSRINLLLVEDSRFVQFFAVPPPRSGIAPPEILARMNEGRGVIGQALREKTIITVPDVTRHPDYINADPATVSELAIPLKNGNGTIVAVLNLESGQKEYFSDDITADALAVASEIQEFLQERIVWEEVKDQRNIMEAINRAELENISVSTLQETVAHLTRLMTQILPARSGAILLENGDDLLHPWKSVHATSQEDYRSMQELDRELCARLATTRSLARSMTGLLQGRTMLVRQLQFEQRLVGFVLLDPGRTAPLTVAETNALSLFMAYAESLVQKMFLKHRAEQLTAYRVATKDLEDSSMKRTDVQQFLITCARKLQEITGADASAYIPFDPVRRQFDLPGAATNKFAITDAKEPAILRELLDAPGLMVLHPETTAGGPPPFAAGAVTEMALRVTLEGLPYGAFYVAFKHPVSSGEEERHMVETFVSDCCLIGENILYVHRIDELSVTDELTGLGNYRAFITRSTEQSERTARFGEIFSLLFFDIDDFKRYNDTYSHLDGNLALQGIADILRHSIRSVDSAYRYGGEEFVILMPGATSTDARKAAERIRASIQRNSSRDHRHFRCIVTVSGGIASFDDRVTDPKNLLLMADLAMYQAKKSGKNAVYLLDSLSATGKATPEDNR